jgi:hypothetical protein
MKRVLFLAALGVMAIAAAARADFVMTFTRSSGTGDQAGNDFIRFYLLNDGTGVTAGTSKLLTLDATMVGEDTGGAPAATLIYRAVDNGDGTSTADFDGTQPVTAAHPHASYIKPTPLAPNQWKVLATVPDETGPTAEFPDMGRIGSFRVIGTANMAAGGVPADSSVNAGRGALIAQASVPTGDNVLFFGDATAENGASQHFPYSPEPTSLGVLAFGLLLRRQRRHA